MPLKGIVCTKTQMLFGVDNQMSSSLRQRYLQGFEGGDLKPARARMCEAYVNGVDGEPVDNLELCRIGGYRPKNADSARGIVWKMFVGLGKDGKLAKEYAKEREYVEFLQAKRAEESEWSAEEIERRLRRNVMENAGEIPVLRTLVANYKGGITIREALVREFNPSTGIPDKSTSQADA